MKNSVILIKKLRALTGAGIVECKKALIKSCGNIEKSIDYLRKIGNLLAVKKSINKTVQGSIFLEVKNDIGVMLELNSETDFVAKNSEFITFGKKIVNTAILEQIDRIDLLREKFETLRLKLVSKFNENISIRRLVLLKNKNIISFLHRNRIGVLAVITADKSQLELAKQIAMHIVSNKPEYLTPEEIPHDVIDREYQVQMNIVQRMNKSKLIADKIVRGRMNKFRKEVSLLKQYFVMNPKKMIEEIIKENSIEIFSFFRFEVGEII